MPDSDSGNRSSDHGASLCNSISQYDLSAEPPELDFDCWGFESSNVDDEIAIYMEDFGSPFSVNHAGGLRVFETNPDLDTEPIHMNVSDDDWENSVLRDLVAIQEEQSNQFENLINAMDNVDELSLSSEDSNMDLEWEHVLPINDHLEESLTEILMFDVDYTEPQFGGGGRSPASKTVVENLALVDLRKEDMIACAICRDDIEEGEIANKLPCSHYYHTTCIVPWLEIRNNCPVCRYELHTDDRRRSRSRSRTR